MAGRGAGVAAVVDWKGYRRVIVKRRTSRLLIYVR